VDDEGYDSRVLIPYSSIAGGLEGAKKVRVEIIFNTTSWNQQVSVHEYDVLHLRSVGAS
jgi:hypothetical protein